jgi:hypothetical protein
MKVTSRILEKHRTLAGLFAVAAISLSRLATDLFANQQQETTMDNSQRDMITALEAAGPHPSLGEQARVFDRFVGTWDCDYANFKDDGTTERARGEVIFGWVLDGRAVQDIWTWTYENTDGQRELGTTVRFFDSKAGKWRIAWIDPVNLAIKILAGGAVGDRIVLEGKTDDGAQIRWSFNEIRKDSFIWRGEKSRDSGKTWRLVAEYHLKRRGASALKGRSN